MVSVPSLMLMSDHCRPSTSPRRRPSADSSQQAASLVRAARARNRRNSASVHVVSSRSAWLGSSMYRHGFAARWPSRHALSNAADRRPSVSRTDRGPSGVPGFPPRRRPSVSIQSRSCSMSFRVTDRAERLREPVSAGSLRQLDEPQDGLARLSLPRYTR